MTDPKVFICYSRSDQDFAFRVFDELWNAGIKVWMDKHSIQPGQFWRFEVQQALDECTHLILIHSEASRNSPEVWSEWTYVIDSKRVVIPLIKEPQVRLPYCLNVFQYITFASNDPYEDLSEELFHDGIQALIDAIYGYWQPSPPDGGGSRYLRREFETYAETDSQMLLPEFSSDRRWFSDQRTGQSIEIVIHQRSVSPIMDNDDTNNGEPVLDISDDPHSIIDIDTTDEMQTDEQQRYRVFISYSRLDQSRFVIAEVLQAMTLPLMMLVYDVDRVRGNAGNDQIDSETNYHHIIDIYSNLNTRHMHDAWWQALHRGDIGLRVPTINQMMCKGPNTQKQVNIDCHDGLLNENPSGEFVWEQIVMARSRYDFNNSPPQPQKRQHNVELIESGRSKSAPMLPWEEIETIVDKAFNQTGNQVRISECEKLCLNPPSP